MRLVASRLTRFEGATEARNARTSWARRGGLLLELEARDGRVGLGDASPLPGLSPDDLDACERALRDVHERLDEPRTDADDSASAVEHTLARLAPSVAAVPAARFALETALFDLAGQRAERSIAALLAAPSPAAEVVARSGLAGAALEPGLCADAARLCARGVHVVKVKVGAPESFEREFSALERLHAALGATTVLRLDANGAWSVDEARARLARLAALGPAWIEEPCAGDDLLRLGRAPIGWAADESLRRPELAARLLDAPGCAAVVVKPALLGGLLAARRLALTALARGLDVVVTHLFDGPVALAAAAELALSLPAAAPCGLDHHAGLGAWPEVELAQLPREGALLVASRRPGLGLDASALHARARASR